MEIFISIWLILGAVGYAIVLYKINKFETISRVEFWRLATAGILLIGLGIITFVVVIVEHLVDNYHIRRYD